MVFGRLINVNSAEDLECLQNIMPECQQQVFYYGCLQIRHEFDIRVLRRTIVQKLDPNGIDRKDVLGICLAFHVL